MVAQLDKWFWAWTGFALQSRSLLWERIGGWFVLHASGSGGTSKDWLEGTQSNVYFPCKFDWGGTVGFPYICASHRDCADLTQKEAIVVLLWIFSRVCLQIVKCAWLREMLSSSTLWGWVVLCQNNMALHKIGLLQMSLLHTACEHRLQQEMHFSGGWKSYQFQV